MAHPAVDALGQQVDLGPVDGRVRLARMSASSVESAKGLRLKESSKCPWVTAMCLPASPKRRLKPYVVCDRQHSIVAANNKKGKDLVITVARAVCGGGC